MSVTTRLFPDSADDSGGDLNPSGLPTGWQCLADASDSSAVVNQLSPTENVRHLEGGFANLPVGVGRVNTVQVGCREYNTKPLACTLAVFVPFGGSTRISVMMADNVVTEHLSALITSYTIAAHVDALTWQLLVSYVTTTGPQAFITRLWLDVDYNPAIGGLRAQMFSLFGPLVAVGLHELPAIAAEVFRRTRTRIPPELYVRAWRELREPGRVYFIPRGA